MKQNQCVKILMYGTPQFPLLACKETEDTYEQVSCIINEHGYGC